MRHAILLATIVGVLPSAATAQGLDIPGSSDAAAQPVVAPPREDPAAVAQPAPLAQPAMGAPAAEAPTGAGSPAPAAPATAQPAGKPMKNGGYVGFSVVTGQGTVYSGGSSMKIDEALATVANITGASGQSPTTLAMMLRLGWGTGDLLFGTQFNWIRSFIDVGGMEAGYDFRGFDLVATWWSQELGLYTRAGVGPAQYRVYAGSSESDPIGGVELMFGVGATMGGLGVGIDMVRQAYDANETGFDSVTYVLAGLSLDLY